MLDTAFPNHHAWILDGGAYALALHLGALAYSDAHGLDGHIPAAVVPHLSLAVPGHETERAVSILLAAGFWTEMSRDIYAVTDYERTNFTKAQADAFRDREATKKRRQRLHAAGDHSLCTSAKWCPVVKEQEKMSRGDTRGTRPGTGPVETRGSIPLHSIRPQGSMDGGVTGNGGGPSGPDSAGAPSSLRSSTARERRESEAERWARADAIVAELFPDTMEDPEALDGILDAASAAGTR